VGGTDPQHEPRRGPFGLRFEVWFVILIGIGAAAATQATWWSVLVLLVCLAAVAVLLRRYRRPH
jgi:hypothetical protein